MHCAVLSVTLSHHGTMHHGSGNQWFSASGIVGTRSWQASGSSAMGRWGLGCGESAGGVPGPPGAGGAVSGVPTQIIQEPVKLKSH